jgi:hypothetical protein
MKVNGIHLASRRVTATGLSTPLLLSGRRFDFGRTFLSAVEPARQVRRGVCFHSYIFLGEH